MASIVITLDLHRLLADQAGGVSVENIADYIPACQAIRQAIHDKFALSVRVYNATVGDWLGEWASGYGDDLVQVRVYRAHDALQDRWNMEIPPLDDREIVRSGLLDEKVAPREGQSFENLILEHFYGTFFSYTVFPAARLAEFLNDLERIPWEKNANRPIVARIYRERLDQWGKKETNEARRALIGKLGRDVKGLKRDLAIYKILRTYPIELGDKVMGETFTSFRRAQVDTEPLAIETASLSLAVTQIEYYLTETQEKLQDADDVVSLLEQVSGYLLEEFNVVESILTKYPEWVTSDLVRRIERKFDPIRAGISTRLIRLRNQVAVSPPSAPDPNWDAPQWLEWVINSYMPYHRWLEAQHKYDAESAEYAAAFADWYYANFIELKNSAQEHFAFSALYNDRQAFLDGDRIALALILDNFNYGLFPQLRRLFNQHNLSLMAEHPVLSLIPTATEVGKPAVIVVTGDLTDLETKDYSTLVEKSWSGLAKGRGKSVKYLSSIGDLQKLTSLEYHLYFLNYLPVDKTLHASSQEVGQEHDERIYNDLKILAETVVEFARRFKIENKLVVYIVSDHGSTRIGKDVVNVLDKRFFKNIADLEHHRFITISDEQLEKLPQMVEAQCYIIDRKKFKTRQNYVAARRYYRFVDTNEDFYVHGGLTPEEVVVPFARFEFQALQVLPPTLQLVEKEFRYAIKSQVQFELGNPNTFALENVYMGLRGVDTDELFVEVLQPKTSMKAFFETVFKREPAAKNTRDLVVRIRYECQGRQFDPIDLHITITLKRMMEDQDDFDL